MKDLFNQNTQWVLISILAFMLILGMLNLSYALGYMMGALTSIFNLEILVHQIDSMLFDRKFNPWLGIPIYILKSLSFMIPLAIALALPKWFNLFAVIVGLLSIKILFYTQEFFFKKALHDSNHSS